MKNSQYLYTFSKNDVISSIRKHYCAWGLAEIRFRSNVFSSKCSRSEIQFNLNGLSAHKLKEKLLKDCIKQKRRGVCEGSKKLWSSSRAAPLMNLETVSRTSKLNLARGISLIFDMCLATLNLLFLAGNCLRITIRHQLLFCKVFFPTPTSISTWNVSILISNR